MGVQFGGFLRQVGLEEDVEGFVDHPMAPGSIHAVEHVEPPHHVFQSPTLTQRSMEQLEGRTYVWHEDARARGRQLAFTPLGARQPSMGRVSIRTY